MSKQKTVNSPETENEVTENLVEQPELVETSSATEVGEEVTETTKESEKPVTVNAKLASVTPVISVKANKTGKMGVYKFLSLYPQDIYIETLLILFYPRSFFTKDEWYQRIEEIQNMPINN